MWIKRNKKPRSVNVTIRKLLLNRKSFRRNITTSRLASSKWNICQNICKMLFNIIVLDTFSARFSVERRVMFTFLSLLFFWNEIHTKFWNVISVCLKKMQIEAVEFTWNFHERFNSKFSLGYIQLHCTTKTKSITFATKKA